VKIKWVNSEIKEVIKISEFLLKNQIDTIGNCVEVKIRWDGKVLWINVDGICVCRVCRINKLILVDERVK